MAPSRACLTFDYARIPMTLLRSDFRDVIVNRTFIVQLAQLSSKGLAKSQAKSYFRFAMTIEIPAYKKRMDESKQW